MLLSRMWQKAAKQGNAFTAFDAMKFFAVLNMTVDHIGAYYFPDQLWLRMIGRITFPVWFFLVGYSRSREIGKTLWLYALLLIPIHPLVGQPIFPVNALFTVILCRLALNWCIDCGWYERRIPELIAASCLLSFVTVPLLEYGSIAFLYTLLGRFVREERKRNRAVLVFWCYVLFVFWQYTGFAFTVAEYVYVAIGTAWVVRWLANCSHDVIWQDWHESRLKALVVILSRNTLPYYFYHRALFQITAGWILGKPTVLIWIDAVSN